jgi:hypothetical protein
MPIQTIKNRSVVDFLDFFLIGNLMFNIRVPDFHKSREIKIAIQKNLFRATFTFNSSFNKILF